MSKSKKKPRVLKITPDNGVIIGASYIGKTIDVPLPAGLAELEGSGPYEIRKKELPDTHRHPYSGPTFDYDGPCFILCKPGCKSPACYCIGECQPWTTNSMKHPYSGPTFDYDGPWSTATERDAAVEQANQALKEQVEKERQRAKEHGWPATTSSPERTPDEIRMAILDTYWARVATEGHRLQRIGIQLRDIVDALESRYSKQARFDRALMWLLFICGWGAFIASLWLRYL